MMQWKAIFWLNSIVLTLGISVPHLVSAASGDITLKHKHFIATLTPERSWYTQKEIWKYLGKPATPPSELRSCSRTHEEIPQGWSRQQRSDWNTQAIAASIERTIGREISRPAGSVRITKTSSGNVVFDGVGLPGRRIDMEHGVSLVLEALRTGISTINVPVIDISPKIEVDDELYALGIHEVVTVGESSFLYSPINRRHNIAVGLRKLNGVLIEKGAIFSFNNALGPVTGRAGFREELVIKGDVTVPDFGGGLCQVSSTVYRGAWEYGLPITQRQNHSYVVRYYAPIGTDATVYPPSVDVKFNNDTPGALLLQTLTDANDHAYTIFYGTKDTRSSEILGPFTWGAIPAPQGELIIGTTDLAPGETRRAGEAHAGVKAVWFRRNTSSSGTVLESFFSVYEARPATIQVGVERNPVGAVIPDNNVSPR